MADPPSRQSILLLSILGIILWTIVAVAYPPGEKKLPPGQEELGKKPSSRLAYRISSEHASRFIIQWSEYLLHPSPEQFSQFFLERWNSYSEQDKILFRNRIISALEFLFQHLSQENIQPENLRQYVRSLLELSAVPPEISGILAGQIATEIRSYLHPVAGSQEKPQEASREMPSFFRQFLPFSPSVKNLPLGFLIGLIAVVYLLFFWLGWLWLKELERREEILYASRKYQFLGIISLLTIFCAVWISQFQGLRPHIGALAIVSGIFLFGFITLTSDERIILFFLTAGIFLTYMIIPQKPLGWEILLGFVLGFLPKQKFSRLWWLWMTMYTVGISAAIGNSEQFIDVFLILWVGMMLLAWGLKWMYEEFAEPISRRRLAELANPQFPLLRELSEKAPGTYSHSLNVAALAEAGAKAVGADPFLVRVGALYHDIGKIARPHFFVENFRGSENPHKEAPPALSARIIIAHVPEGIHLAEKFRLPLAIHRFILTHHGRGKVEGVEIPEDEADSTGLFYPGEKPVSKEEALLLIADAVEAFSRSIPDESKEALYEQILRMIHKKISDGMLSEAKISLEEIHRAVRAMTDFLAADKHRRSPYPTS
ncbi:MAG: HDIG domain-containing metalloprotein [bacterium JZ-2024 1]